jgi:hypothetical protein
MQGYLKKPATTSQKMNMSFRILVLEMESITV